VRTNIYASYPKGIHPPEVHYARTRAVMERLAPLHPILAQLYYVLDRSGKKRAARPIGTDISYAEWQEYDRQARSRDKDHSLGTGFSIWYRSRDEQAGPMVLDISYDVTSDTTSQFYALMDVPPALKTPELMLAIMDILIDITEADSGDIVSFPESRDPLIRAYWKIWLKDGVPFPKPNIEYNTRNLPLYEANHPEPTSQNRWRDGTLYTWDMHAPWLLNEAT
jgi:hypothetical protein